jgi:hypothetical protein
MTDVEIKATGWAGRFGISTSIAVLATSAMAHAGTEGSVTLNKDVTVSEDMRAQIDAVLGKRTVREAVNGSFAVIVKKFEDEGTTLEDKYFQSSMIGDKSKFDKLAQNTLGATEPYAQIDLCYQNCYGNCHGACHGSRGWR